MLRCLVIPGPDFEPFLLEHPRVLYRMLQAEARRLRDTTEWKITS
jgi:CRP-like cAMP-binding protein